MIIDDSTKLVDNVTLAVTAASYQDLSGDAGTAIDLGMTLDILSGSTKMMPGIVLRADTNVTIGAGGTLIFLVTQSWSPTEGFLVTNGTTIGVSPLFGPTIAGSSVYLPSPVANDEFVIPLFPKYPRGSTTAELPRQYLHLVAVAFDANVTAGEVTAYMVSDVNAWRPHPAAYAP